MIPFAIWFGVGAMGLTVFLQGVHMFLFAPELQFFFRNNVLTAISMSNLETNPWSSGNYQWIFTSGWIIFPALALFASLCVLIRTVRGKARVDRFAVAFLHCYMYAAIVMIVMTIRENRLLEFAHFASILIPWLFLALGLTVFKVPDSWRTPKLGLLVALWCAISVDLLSPIGLYHLVVGYGLAPLYVAGIIGIALRLLWPRKTLAWIACLSLLAPVNFGFAPSYPGLAWRMESDSIAATRRVADAIMKIENRLPVDAYPSFWINNTDDRFTSEYRAIMCGFVAHGLSMYTYPEVEPGRVFQSGTFLILITQDKDVFDSANQKMSQAGMPLSLYAQDVISDAGVTYWLTYVRVLRAHSLHPGLGTGGARS